MLDSNKCKAILRHKARILQANDLRVVSEAAVSGGTELRNKEIDKFGEVAVKRLKQSYRKNFSENDIEQIVSGYKSGKTTIELAGQFGCCKNTINKLLRQHGVEVTREKAQTKLDTEVVIAMYEKRHTIEEIAKRFSVSPYTISRCLHSNGVKTRDRWDYATK